MAKWQELGLDQLESLRVLIEVNPLPLWQMLHGHQTGCHLRACAEVLLRMARWSEDDLNLYVAEYTLAQGGL